MSNDKQPQALQVVHDQAPRISIPKSVSFRDAAEYCAAKADEEEAVAPHPIELIATLPWAAAYALQRVLERDYSATRCPNGAQQHPPTAHAIRTGRGVVTVHWTGWLIHGLGTAWMAQRMDRVTGRMDFYLEVRCKRQDRERFEELRDRFLAEVAKRELYQGSALQLDILPAEEGESASLDLRNPLQALPIDRVLLADDLILEPSMERSVRAEVFYPIQHAAELRESGIACRRGILLAGRPGTGKTLTARIAASMAIRQGWTVFYLADARGLAEALRLAQAHAPALLVAEDIDRTLAGERDSGTDAVLNCLDGLDRSAELVLIATTNDPSSLPAPLLRPGRLDSFLVFEAPDASAARRLVAFYLNLPLSLISTEVGDACAGLLSAGIREVVSRATLHALAGDRHAPSDEDLIQAAKTVRAQQAILELAEKPASPEAPLLRVRLDGNGNGKAGDYIEANRVGSLLRQVVTDQG